jgi:UDP-glucose 4-epimerase
MTLSVDHSARCARHSQGPGVSATALRTEYNTAVRVLVVGGSGFVGRHVVRLLREEEHSVLNADLRAPGSPWPGEQIAALDLLAPGAIETLARGAGAVDGVVWLAAVIRKEAGIDERARADLALMVDAPLRLVRALPRAPRAVVHASSVKVYSPPERTPVDENHPAHPVTPYGVSKLCAEHYLDILGRQRGCPVASLRLAFVYGPGQHPDNAFPRFVAAVRRGEAPVIHGSGADVRDDVYVGDVARAVLATLDRGVAGSFNIASGRPRTLLEAAQAVCRLGGAGLVPRHVDQPSRWVDRVFAAEKAREQLGFEAATSLEEGLRAMWEASGA